MPIWRGRSTTIPPRACGCSLIIDLGGGGVMDSSGIGLILGRQRCARVLGTSLRLQHAPAQLQKVLRLAGIPCTENIEKENAQ